MWAEANVLVFVRAYLFVCVCVCVCVVCVVCVCLCVQVVLLVTQTFLQDDWSGFTVVLAQGSISDTMPDRVLLLCLGPLRPGPLRSDRKGWRGWRGEAVAVMDTYPRCIMYSNAKRKAIAGLCCVPEGTSIDRS